MLGHIHLTLPRTLALSYALLVVLACLYPMQGWSSTGLPWYDFLFEAWPRYYSHADLVENFLAYAPLGFLLILALPGSGRARDIVPAVLLAGTLSLAVEATQNFLPARVASNVDLGCNVLGAFAGACIGHLVGRNAFSGTGWISAWRNRHIIRGRTGDTGLVLLALWLMTQFRPDAPPFAIGDLRQMLDLPLRLDFSAERFMQLEASQVASGLLGIGLLARCMLRRHAAILVCVLVGLGLLIKTQASYSWLAPGAAFAWMSPGIVRGLALGFSLLLFALLLPRVLQHALAGMALLIATTLNNLIPPNPYFLIEQQMVATGNFLNFYGLIQLIALAWPFLALSYLSALGLWRGDHLRLD